MNNPDPYRGPDSSLDMKETPADSRRFGGMFWLLAGAATFFSLLLAIIGTFVVPSFERVYSAFGSDLPWTTALMLRTHHLWWAAPAVAAVLWVISLWAPARLQYRGRLMLAFIFLCVGSSLAISFAIVALYAPIFVLGKPV